MNFWQRCTSALFGRLTPEERTIYKVQFVLLFAISTLLYLGFPGLRQWRQLAEEMQVQSIIRGWDGLAWYVWLAAAPLMLVLIRRYPLTRGRIKHSLKRILLGSVAIYLVVAHVRYFLRGLPVLLWSPDWKWLTHVDTYAYNTFAMLPLDFLTYCGFFAVSLSIVYHYRQRHDAEEAVQLQLKTAQLQSDLARAELAALRGQLHPHFLFNSFNAVATLVRQHKNETAVEIIAQLSALLRLAIDRTGLQEIPLSQELDFIRRYLEIEHVRFGDKLKVEFAVTAQAEEALVPNIVLQPLVENAIKHGISLRTTPGLVRVAAETREQRLLIEIADDGAEEPPPSQAGAPARKPGIGLTNTRAQLDKLYGVDYRLEIAKQPSGRTIVSLDLPLRSPASA